jgi:hypothetical protein
MSKDHGHNHRAGPHKEPSPHGFHRPYWKHAHYDWRLWVAASLMLLAIFTYVMSYDLAWRPRSQSYQPVSGSVHK